MRLKHFSDSDLVSQTKLLVREETKATQEVLRHLREIETRGLHLARGYRSLHEFCVEELGYSDGGAARRVQAMRLIRDLPETETMLAQGALTLETMSTLQRHFQTTQPSPEKKQQLVQAALHRSKRELEKSLGKPDVKPVYLSAELLRKVDELKGIYGITSVEKIFEKLVDQALKQASKGGSSSRPKAKTSEPASSTGRASVSNSAPSLKTTPPAERVPPSFSRYRSVKINRHIIQREKARCAYTDKLTGRRCTETRFLQFDHIFPFALGGETSMRNLQLLCANHNRYKSRQIIGKRIQSHK